MNNTERLMSKTVQVGSCLEFTGGIGSHGYGVIWINGKNQNAHKASYILNKGAVPDGVWVLHTCDNKKCINPDHLYLGDRKQNTIDAMLRGRLATGDRNGRRTKPDAYHGRERLINTCEYEKILLSPLKKTELAKIYGVNLLTIYRTIGYAKAAIAQATIAALNSNNTEPA